jgi:hypothetical protein
VIALGEVFTFRRDWHQDDRALPLVRQYQLTLDAILRDAILGDRPGLANCAVHCCHCGIRFLTHPRNAKREDLRCEFGCRECHRRQLASARSRKHYQTDHGWWNKKLLNGKRSAAAVGNEQGASPEIATPDTTSTDGETSCSATSLAVESASQLPLAAADPVAPVAFAEAPGQEVEFTRECFASSSPAATASDALRGGAVELTLEGFTLDEATLANSPMLPYLAMVASLLEDRTVGPGELLDTLQECMRQRSFDRLPRREYVLRFLAQHPP